MCIFCTYIAARLAALYGRWPVAINSVPSDRIKAALPLIALRKWVCGGWCAGTTVVGRTCLQLEPFASIGLRPSIPP